MRMKFRRDAWAGHINLRAIGIEIKCRPKEDCPGKKGREVKKDKMLWYLQVEYTLNYRLWGQRSPEKKNISNWMNVSFTKCCQRPIKIRTEMWPLTLTTEFATDPDKQFQRSGRNGSTWELEDMGNEVRNEEAWIEDFL